MNSHKNLSVYERCAYYVKAATAQGAFHSIYDLLDRFLKTTGKSIQLREKKRYVAQLKKLAPSFGFRFITIKKNSQCRRGVTSIHGSHFNEDHELDDDLIHAFVNEIRKAEGEFVKVYDVLTQLSTLCRAMLSAFVTRLRHRSAEFDIHFEKAGRVLMVKSTKKYFKKISYTGVNSPYIKAKDSKNLNTPSGELRFEKKKTTKKAFWLMRELKGQFYDNVKVKVSEGMLFRFSQWALDKGFEDERIKNVFNYALLKRHADATDMGLNSGNFSFKFEMSSTVSLAKELLLKDGKTIKDRWNELKSVIFPKRFRFWEEPPIAFESSLRMFWSTENFYS